MAQITGQHIVATFADLEKANDAALELSQAGIEANRVSIVGAQHEEAASDPDTRLRDMEATGEIAKRAGAGGGAGAALGALAGATAFIIPGIGPVVAGGIWAGVLGGGIAGGVVGGMVGGISGLSLEEFDLKYQDVLREGKAMVAVAVDDDEAADQARRVLEKEDPEDIHMIGRSGERIGD